MRTNSWSWESKSENKSRSSAPQIGRPEKARLFEASPFLKPFSPRYSGYPVARAQSREPASTQPWPLGATHPVSRIPSAQAPPQRICTQPTTQARCPSSPTREHYAESRTPPHAVRASSCCARATGPQSAVPILPGR